VNGHYAQAGGPNGAFLELETVRSVLRFLDYQNRGLKLKDRGMRASRRAVEAEDADGRVTTYSLEPDGRVSRLEFLDGQSINMLTGQPIPLVQSYEFSGHRVIQGVLTPMKIELFINGLRSDSMELSSVRYNSAIPDSQFRP